MKQYAWRHGVCGCSAQVAGEMMESIEERDGTVTPISFLEASRPVDSPTHNAFEWDDSVAAEKFRLTQSRQIINNITIRIVSDDTEKQKKHTAFVNVVEGRHKPAKYRSVEVAMNDEIDRSVVLKNAMQELDSFQRKYEKLTELAELFAEIEKVRAKYDLEETDNI